MISVTKKKITFQPFIMSQDDYSLINYDLANTTVVIQNNSSNQ